jgi:hypothetical protein
MPVISRALFQTNLPAIEMSRKSLLNISFVKRKNNICSLTISSARASAARQVGRLVADNGSPGLDCIPQLVEDISDVTDGSGAEAVIYGQFVNFFIIVRNDNKLVWNVGSFCM